MSTERDVTRIVRSWLHEDAHEEADRILNLVLEAVDTTPQRRSFWLARRFPPMSTYLKVGLAAAVVVLAAFIGIQLLGGSNVGEPGPEASRPTATATPEVKLEPSPPTSPPPLSQSFASPLHGISVSYPEGWTAQAATEPWTTSTFPHLFQGPQFDWLYDPDLNSSLFLAIASQPIGDSTPEDWLAEQITSQVGCTAGKSITVDGATGYGAIDCPWVVVTTGGRGYWIQLVAEPEAPPSYDDAWFEEILATVQLQPEDAVDTAQSPSP
jgi:hypothetical protein